MTKNEALQCLQQLKWAVQALACEPATQLELFPHFTDKPFELGDDFDHWYSATRWRPELNLLQAQHETLEAIHSHLAKMAPDSFTEKEVREGAAWHELRQRARQALLVFGWEFAIPPQNRSWYVKGS